MTMDKEAVQDIMDALDALLEDERRVVLAGELDAIPDLLQRKEALFDQLNKARFENGADLEMLQSKMSRNQALLEGALRGIRAVADRMSTLRRMRNSLETYDRQGQKQSFTTKPGNKIEKRA
jgi:flagellar biosynthesis/type III secretory pathway chaperone